MLPRNSGNLFAAIVLAFSFCLIVGGALPAAAQEKKQDKKARAALVQVDEVVREPVTQFVPLIGRLVAETRGNIAARVSAVVMKLEVKVGDRVEKGQILARLVKDRIAAIRDQQAASLSQSKAELETRKSQMEVAEKAVARLERLRANQSAAFREALYEDRLLELATARSRMAESEAAIQRAKANLAVADLELSYTVIRAPYPAVVTEVHRQSGTFVSVGSPVVTLLDDKDLEIEVEVPAERIAAMQPGRLVHAVIAGQRFTASVRAQVPDEDPRTRTRKVRLIVPLEDKVQNLAANQSVSVEVPIGEAREILSVHKDAVINQNNEYVVFLVQDGQAQKRKIEVGDGVGERFEVLSGLQAGDKVVTRGNERLFPGQPVRY